MDVHSFKMKRNHVLFAWHPIQHVYVQCYISKWKNCMLFRYMKSSGVSDVDLCSVSCSFAWLSFPWEKERLSCFQLIMLSSISRVHAHKWHFQECCLNLQRTKNRRNSKSESTLPAHNNKEHLLCRKIIVFDPCKGLKAFTVCALPGADCPHQRSETIGLCYISKSKCFG